MRKTNPLSLRCEDPTESAMFSQIYFDLLHPLHYPPYSEHHTQNTILRTPYSEHHTQNTILRTPYSEHHTQNTILRTPYSEHHTQNTILRAFLFFSQTQCILSEGFVPRQRQKHSLQNITMGNGTANMLAAGALVCYLHFSFARPSQEWNKEIKKSLEVRNEFDFQKRMRCV